MTYRYNKQWGQDANLTTSYEMVNHRIVRQSPYEQWQYDADGRALVTNQPEPFTTLTYDAAGQLIKKHDYPNPGVAESRVERVYSGDGREIKRTTEKCELDDLNPNATQCQWMGAIASYYVRSTVLGGEVISDGENGVRYVRVGSQILAHLRPNGGPNPQDAAYYEHRDASGMSYRMTKRQMPFGYGDYSDDRQAEYDAGGTNVGLVTTYNPRYGTSGTNFR